MIAATAATLDFTGSDPQLHLVAEHADRRATRGTRWLLVGIIYVLYTLDPRPGPERRAPRTFTLHLPEGTVLNPRASRRGRHAQPDLRCA